MQTPHKMDTKPSLFTLLAETFASQAFLFCATPPKTFDDSKRKDMDEERLKLQHLNPNSKLYSCLNVGSTEGPKEDKKDALSGMTTQNLLVLKEVVERHKGKSVNLQQFVTCMKLLLGEKANQPHITSELVDLYSRINIKGQPAITFNDISSFLMALSNDVRTDKYSFQYKESAQEDMTVHHNYIEKVYYIPTRDEIIFYEQSMKTVRIYDPLTLSRKRDHLVNGTILCIEYIDSYKLIAVALSNRDLLFIESDDTHKGDKEGRKKIHCPDSTLTMNYVSRLGYLFTGGLTGAIYGWDMKILNSIAYAKYDPTQSSAYTMFLVPGLPWFQTHEISLMLDVFALDSLVVGYSDGGIRIWSLKV